MKEWNYTFDPVKKDEWLAQIKRDLKDASIDSLQSQWWEGEFVQPFHHPDDVLEKVSLPDEYFTNPPLIMEWINASTNDGLRISGQVKSSLKYGAQCIVFENINSLSDLNLWLEDVHRDMVEISADVSSASNENFSPLLQSIPSTVGVRLYRNTDSTPQTLSHLLAEKKTDHTVQFIYRVPPGENWINEVVKMFNAIIRDFNQNESNENFFGDCRIMIEAESSFVKQLIQLRVIQLVWLNITSQFGKQGTIFKSPVEYHIHTRDTRNPDQFLITAATSALCASLTGVLAICIHHLDLDPIPGHYGRINRNIHHLLALETQIYKGVDPIQGSYSIDFYSAKWIQKILNRLSAIN